MSKVQGWIQDNPSRAALCAAGGTIGFLLWIGGSIIVTGVIAGILMAVGVAALVWRIRQSETEWVQRLYKTVVKYPLACDIGLTALAFLLAPAGITAWIAATVTGLLASAWLFHEEAQVMHEAQIIAITEVRTCSQ